MSLSSPPVHLFDIPFDPLTQAATLEIIKTRLKEGKKTRIVTINPEFVLEAEKNSQFKKILQTADLHLADGIGILWATNFLRITNYGLRITNNKLIIFIKLIWSLLLLPFLPYRYQNPLPEKITGSGLFTPLMKILAEEKQIVFLLGAAPGVAEIVAEKFRKQSISELKHEFKIHTYAGSPNENDAEAIIHRINNSQATALLVAFQFPKQDIWIAEHIAKMPHIKVAMGVGGTFDSIAGSTHIAHQGFKARKTPALFLRLNLEWLWRLITQPYRWKRIFNATFVFIWKTYQEKLRITDY